MKLVNKISIKTVYGKVAREDAKGQDLMRVMGVVRGVTTGESNYGPWAKFKGEFKAINLSTGEEVHSGACLLPPMASDMLQGAFTGDPVEFAFDIGIKPNETAIGYEYTVTPLITQESDPLANLAARLPAPK